MPLSSTILQRIRKLSLRGRLAMALCCFSGYCVRRGIKHPEVRRFVEHLVRVLTSEGEELRDWEDERPPLIEAGLGYEYPLDFEQMLAVWGVKENEFRRLICNVTEIVFGSLHGAADENGSRSELCEVIEITQAVGVECPDPSWFEVSAWSDSSH